MSPTWIALFFASFNLGLGPISWSLLGDTLPEQLKTPVVSAAVAFGWLISLMATLTFDEMIVSLGGTKSKSLLFYPNHYFSSALTTNIRMSSASNWTIKHFITRNNPPLNKIQRKKGNPRDINKENIIIPFNGKASVPREKEKFPVTFQYTQGRVKEVEPNLSSKFPLIVNDSRANLKMRKNPATRMRERVAFVVSRF
ncbi:Facilitated trehalose transporter Tret1-1 [Melipona quadrifasciata]|uniref:Facilitated trehalose transporter Tret1-1 n=1 Tax=Melipona quadrifasciata TaxID=166423 RepID=A0A0N0BHA6_9HYME|nr:Facilitated trehalose transporter Tret1-1 [Melipona quadrifasciata]